VVRRGGNSRAAESRAEVDLRARCLRDIARVVGRPEAPRSRRRRRTEQAQPIDRTVTPDPRHRLAIADDGKAFDTASHRVPNVSCGIKTVILTWFSMVQRSLLDPGGHNLLIVPPFE
jgi:hypothetical protein